KSRTMKPCANCKWQSLPSPTFMWTRWMKTSWWNLHALFDAHLISFEPVCGEYRLCGSYLLDKTGYASFAGATLRQPNERQWRPNTVFLEAHRIEFDRSEKKREKAGLLPY
ncbi:MAG: hypothetical protein KH292_08140, partial [Collinsella sp.]|nr:hypothetical protein [Collinsella sp.]